MNYAYYNDNDSFCCEWLRNLIKTGLIADGVVDERPIQEVSANDLKGFTQVHMFAGIGGWSRALRLAGWPDDRPVWTGSCPCQPFSCAGKRKGEKDERHLWPEWLRLIATSLPATIVGEQVASAIGHGWLDNVFFDMEKIVFWRRFYEDMHEVQEAAKKGRLPQVLGEVARRATASVPGLSEEIRNILEAEAQGTETIDARKEKGERQALEGQVQSEQQGKLFGIKNQEEMPSEKIAIRPRQAHTGVERKNIKRIVRDEWHTVAIKCRKDDVQQPVPRPNYPVCGLCVLQRLRGVLRNERRNGKLGRGCLAPSSICVDGKEIADDERKLAEQFRKFLKATLGCKRLSGILPVLAAEGYAVGAAVLPACSVGAPHRRERLWFVADAQRHATKSRRVAKQSREGHAKEGTGAHAEPRRCGNVGSVANTAGARQTEAREYNGGASLLSARPEQCGRVDGMADAAAGRRQETERNDVPARREPDVSRGGSAVIVGDAECGGLEGNARRGTSNIPANSGIGGFWADAEWIPCRDGKYRAVEPVLEQIPDGLSAGLGLVRLERRATGEKQSEIVTVFSPLVAGSKNRTGRLRGYGNSIVSQVAAEFVRAYMEGE